MSDFVEMDLGDGGQVLFQTAESALVREHGGSGAEVERAEAGLQRLREIALATNKVCESFREKVAPDEMTMEIGVGLSGEVGWFFAKSEMEATMKVTFTWKSQRQD